MNQTTGFSTERQSQRYKVDLRMKVYFSRADGQQVFVFGQGSDICEGGMSAYIPAELQITDKVDIEVKLPYSKAPIVLRGEVRNRSGFRYGLEFLLIQDADREVLLRSLKALSLIQ